MEDKDLSRRDFHRLTLAAFGGVLAGALGTAGRLAADDAKKEGESQLLKEPHTCCGLNTCKGHGKGGSNECAGQGSCHTAEAHGCQGGNKCAGQGGCGETAGQNACKGQGACAVPLTADTWKKTRANFEAAMTKAGKKFGPAPANCGK
jgi:hypothetical protein